MELPAKIVDYFQLLNIFAKCFPLMLDWTIMSSRKTPPYRSIVLSISSTMYIIAPQLNHLSTNPKKWSNTLKQFVDNLPTNCLSVFDHFVKLAFKGLNKFENLLHSFLGIPHFSVLISRSKSVR